MVCGECEAGEVESEPGGRDARRNGVQISPGVCESCEEPLVLLEHRRSVVGGEDPADVVQGEGDEAGAESGGREDGGVERQSRPRGGCRSALMSRRQGDRDVF